MKNRLFILIPTAIIAFVALCVGAVFATAYLAPEPEAQEYVYPEEITLASPAQKKNVDAKLLKVTEGETVSYAKYIDENKNAYTLVNDKLVGELRIELNHEDPILGKAIGMDKAREIACDFFADGECFGDCTITKEWVNNSNRYQFEFRKTYGKDGGFIGSTGFIIQIRKDGEIFSWRTPGPGMDEFDPASVADLTVDDVYAYCDEQIDGEFEIDHMMIEKYDGIFKIGCRCLIDEGRDFVVIRYPIG